MMNQDNTGKRLKVFIVGIIVYFLFSGASYAGFAFVRGGRTQELVSPESLVQTDGEAPSVDPDEPKTETCPLNGKLYTKTERGIWEKKRPLAVMIENHTEARPQSGLSFADAVYEAVAEGGITRFMGVFYCGVAAQNVRIAPVRSARTYFLDWVSEYDALYNHVGGANCSRDKTTGQCTTDERAQALEQIDRYGIKDMDQFGISYPTCFRSPDRLDHPVATEHQMVCLSGKLYDIAKERGWGNIDNNGIAWDEKFKPWKFAEKEEPASTPTASNISFGFWEGYKDFDVRWEYDPETNRYKRFMGSEPHTDFETKQQLAAKVVVVQFTKEVGPVDGHKHLLYETIGKGKALVFQNGKVIEGSWKKEKRTARTIYFDKQGQEVEFVPGQIWIEVVPKGNKVEY